MMRRFYHPLPLRVWHWLNAALFFALIGTGACLRFHGIAALRPHDPVLAWHKGLGLAMIGTTLFRYVYISASGQAGRHYGIRRGDLRGMAAQARFYLLGIFSGAENPFKATVAEKYNPLQRAAYGAVMFFFLPVQAVTGLLFMNIFPWRDQLLATGMVGSLGAVHVLGYYLLVLYLVVHIYMATLGETFFSHTKAMITGFAEEEKGEGG
jgi:thiosulfate reductase cytochrome b subunit